MHRLSFEISFRENTCFSPKLSASSIIKASPNFSNLSLMDVWLQIFPFFIEIFIDIARWKSRIFFLIHWRMFGPPEALQNHTLSKSCYLIHELFPINHLSFQELINSGPPYLSLPSLNRTTYLASNLTSTNLILSPCLLNFPFFLCLGFGIVSVPFPWHYLPENI